MRSEKMFIVSHAPFWHNGSNVAERHYGMLLAAMPAVALGIVQYGLPAVAVIAMSISTAIFWEWLMNRATKRTITVGDGNAALLGLLFAMLIPATTPWWVVMVGTLLTVVIGLHIFGGIGGNAFNPVVLAVAILAISWKYLFDFDAALLNYDPGFMMAAPLVKLKAFGVDTIKDYSYVGLFFGRQAGGIGSGFGLGLIAGGVYLATKKDTKIEDGSWLVLDLYGEIHEYDWSVWSSYYGENLNGLHMPFNFGLLRSFWAAPPIRTHVQEIEAAVPPGAWPNYVLGNHDPLGAHAILPDVQPQRESSQQRTHSSHEGNLQAFRTCHGNSGCGRGNQWRQLPEEA